MSAASIQQSHHDSPVAAAMIAAGWSNEMIGAAFRAALVAKATPESHLVGDTVAGGDTVGAATVSSVTLLDNVKTNSVTPGIVGLQVGNSQLAKARAAMAQHPHLTRNGARVGLAILDHRNSTTGRCDPGIQGIMVRSKVSHSGVFRAIKALVGYGFLWRDSYGGMNHCNSYVFDFERCAAMANGTVGNSVNSVTADTQTLKQNITTNSLRGSEVVGGNQGQRQLPLVQVVAGGSNISTMARRKATTRLWKAFDALHKGRGAMMAKGISQEVWDTGVSAEMHKRGSGLAVLLDGLTPELQEPRQATGPP